jgi:CHRD domain
VAGAEAAFAAALSDGRAYLNIHTENFPSGEIRGFLFTPDTGPAIVCFGLGLIGLGMFRRKFGTRPKA